MNLEVPIWHLKIVRYWFQTVTKRSDLPNRHSQPDLTLSMKTKKPPNHTKWPRRLLKL